jgi:hypothetical protein
MERRNIEGFVFSKKSNPFYLEKMGTHCIYGDGICANDQAFVGLNISPVKKMGSPPVKLGRENTEDIQASLSLHDGISPYFAQRRAPLIMVGPRV